ncbi:MAG TPA: hypothetical protein VGI45_26490 [Terracidiphilus sp.]|jgi:hypothetical protein
MTIANIVDELDAEIARLHQVKKLLSNGSNVRPGNQVAKKSPGRKKRTLSAEARKKIAEAQRKRWAAQKAKK